MNLAGRALIVSALAVVAGCKNVAPATDQPAVIVNPDAASRAALQAVVNTALQTEVALADDALTKSSLLVIERRIPPTFEGSAAGGRTMEPPIQFQLVVNGAECALIDQRNQVRSVLENTACEAEQ